MIIHHDGERYMEMEVVELTFPGVDRRRGVRPALIRVGCRRVCHASPRRTQSTRVRQRGA